MLRFALKIVGLVGFILLAGGFLAAPSAHAQTPAPDWSPVYPPVSANTLNNVECRAEQCFAVGTNGTILYSLNAGMDWQRSSSAFYTSTLYGIACASQTTCYATGENGLLLKTTNTGEAWQKQELGITQTVRAVACSDGSQCYAFAENGAFFQTTGGNWTQVSSQYWLTGTLLSCPATGICFANGAGLYKTTNGGVTWDSILGRVTALDCVDTQICYATSPVPGNPSYDSVVYRTNNGGANWAEIYQTAFPVVSIACATANDCFLATVYLTTDPYPSPNANMLIYYTHNGGLKWEAEYMNTFLAMKDIDCLDSQRCIGVAGKDGPLDNLSGIIGTNNGGKIWTRRDDSVDNSLFGVSCPTAETCFTVGGRGSIFKTSDSSFTWHQQTAPISTTLYGVACPSVNLCIAVGELGKIRYTTDGTNWNSTNAGQQDLYGVSCPSPTECIVVGTGGAIFRMGATPGAAWTLETSGTTNRLFGVSCPIAGTCYAVGENGVLLRKSSGGWVAENSGTILDLRAISCPAATTCYASETVSGSIYSGQPTQGGRVISTTSGTSWAGGSQVFLYKNFSIQCPTVLICYAGGILPLNTYNGRGSKIASTTNGGATWNVNEAIGSIEIHPLAIACSASTTCAAVGTNSTIVRTVNGGKWGNYSVDFANNYISTVFNASCANGSTRCVAYGVSYLRTYLLTTKDNGSNWRVTLFTNISSGYLSCPSAQVCYIGAGLKSTDGGETWQKTGSNVSLSRLDCPTENICQGYGYSVDADRFWRTTDGGSTWISSTVVENSFSAVSLSERGLECPTEQICYTVFNSYGPTNTLSIYKTSDAGLNWSLNYSTTVITSSIFTLSCPSEQTCYALGLYGKYAKTSNGGADWQISQVSVNSVPVPSESVPSGTMSIGCVNETTCLIGTTNGALVATRDGGANWQLLPQRTKWAFYYTECEPNGICRAFGDNATIVTGKLPACSLTVSKTVDDGTCGTLRAAVESALTGESIVFELGATPQPLQLSSNLTIPTGVNLTAASCATPKITVQGTNNPTLRLSGSSRLEGWLFNGVQLLATSGGNMPNLIKCVQVQR
jgi:photosystem II stability/assembly factor-like uncharacterized protein